MSLKTWDISSLEKRIVVTGHYGSGKTNLALNLAFDLARTGAQVTLVDLDVVNPYFRSSEYDQDLIGKHIRVIAPTFAGTTLDTPSLPAEMYSAFEQDGYVIFDVGGDDVGATALGRFSKDFANAPVSFLYVINRNRNLTQTPEEAVDVLREIEHAAHLKATGIVNNSHLQSETTSDVINAGMAYAQQVARLADLPLLATTYPADIVKTESIIESQVCEMYPVKIYVCPPWQRVPL